MAKTCIALFFLTLVIHEAINRPNTVCYEVIEERPDNNIDKRQVDCSSILQQIPVDQSTSDERKRRPPVLTEEEKKKKQARAFEGLLHLATVVNHVDTFLMEKGKLFLKSLGKMVASEEDNRFDV